MDIISSLPDPILCHILSFLPIHFSVTTSVLARRWRFLWTFVRRLHFVGDNNGLDPENRIGFPDMVYRVLMLHKGSIDTLCLLPKDDNIINLYQIDAWISTAIARGVQVLSLSNVRLSQSCFNCKTLVELTIKGCTITAKPGAVCLPRLKELNLYCNSYEDDECLPNLVSGCSAIENLVVERSGYGCGMTCCYVCSPTLKSLVLKFVFACYGPHRHQHKIFLDVPAVQYLRLHDDTSHIIQTEKLSSLVTADIWFPYYSTLDDDINRLRAMSQFVEKLSTAKSLRFRNSAPMKFPRSPFSFATTTRFHNLADLEFKADWHILTELLACASKLEILTVQEVDVESKCWREPKHLSTYPLSCLRYVNIFGFAGGEHELNMIRYILKHAIVLKIINIYALSYCKLNIFQGISNFPRGSKKCHFLFFRDM